MNEYFPHYGDYGKYAYIMPFAELAEQRLSTFKKINQSILDDVNCASMLRYTDISLWACEQQLLWERLFVTPKRRSLHSFFIFLCGQVVAYGLLAWLIVRMRLSRAHVLVYGIDRGDLPYMADNRIAGIYRFLKDKKIAYGEIFHTIFGKDFFMNSLRRRRPAFYMDIAYGERRIPVGMAHNPTVLSRLRAAVYIPTSIAFMRCVLRLTGARVIFSIDDTRYYYPLMIAAKECNIPFYAFQHGRFSSHMPGWVQYGIDPSVCPFPDAVFVWSAYWRSALLEISPVARMYADRVRIGGNPGVISSINMLMPPHDDGVLTFLIPHEDAASELDMQVFIRAILADPTVRIIYKLRRGRHVPSFISEFADNKSFQTCFDIKSDDWLYIDGVLGSYSTFLYEVIALGRPVGIFDSIAAQASDLVHGGYATPIWKKSALQDVYGVVATPWKEICRRRDIFKSSGSLYETLSGIMPV